MSIVECDMAETLLSELRALVNNEDDEDMPGYAGDFIRTYGRQLLDIVEDEFRGKPLT